MKQLIPLLASLAFFCIGCSDETEPQHIPQENALSEEIHKGISRESNEITSTEASYVASVFTTTSFSSRTNKINYVKNVIPIMGSDNQPALFVVNMNDGYLIISATKKCYPILMIADSGEYSLNDAPSGRNVVVQELIEMSQIAKDGPIDPEIRNAWRKYENPFQDSRMFPSRATPQELRETRGELIAQLKEKGYDIILTTDEEWYESIPEPYRQNFIDYIEGEKRNMQEDFGLKAYEAGVIAIDRNNGFDHIAGPFTTTKWDQEEPYNNSDVRGRLLGCVTVAVAQLMKFYKYPTSFKWDLMPDELSYTDGKTLPDFLFNLRNNLGVNDSGGANIEDALRVLRQYGYDAQITQTKPSLKVIYTRGVDKTLKKGHAWLIDGTSHHRSQTCYYLYFPQPDYLPDLKYEVVYECQYIPNDIYSEHMNWGWGEGGGWVHSGSAKPYIYPEGGPNFSSDRKYIKFTVPTL